MIDILVVDDDAELAEVVGLLLEQAGYTARIARSLEEALARVADARPDVVIADWNMPGGGAGDLRIRLCAIGLDGVPVVVMTGMSGQSAEGFAAVLPKPFPAERLLQLVEDYARQRGAADAPV